MQMQTFENSLLLNVGYIAIHCERGINNTHCAPITNFHCVREK